MSQENIHKNVHNVWGEGGVHAGEYTRHSVDRDVQFFMGWDRLSKLLDSIGPPMCRKVILTVFKAAARINEGLPLQTSNFQVYDNFIAVTDFAILKRYKKIGTIVVCKRCGTEHDEYEMKCTKCEANLAFAGRKRYVTKKRVVYRQPFFIPRDEPFDEEFVTFIQSREGLLFPSTDARRIGKPYSDGWVYSNVHDLGHIVGLDSLYNHYFRAQRMMQLANERHFTKGQLKVFTGITEDRTIEHYVKEIESYANDKLGLNVTPEMFSSIMEEAKRRSFVHVT